MHASLGRRADVILHAPRLLTCPACTPGVRAGLSCADVAACTPRLTLSCRNYSAPSGVPKPSVGSANMVKLPSGASEFGMVEAAPNWDDYMTPGAS